MSHDRPGKLNKMTKQTDKISLQMTSLFWTSEQIESVLELNGCFLTAPHTQQADSPTSL